MSQIKKFNIEIPQSKLDDLQQRLTLQDVKKKL